MMDSWLSFEFSTILRTVFGSAAFADWPRWRTLVRRLGLADWTGMDKTGSRRWQIRGRTQKFFGHPPSRIDQESRPTVRFRFSRITWCNNQWKSWLHSTVSWLQCDSMSWLLQSHSLTISFSQRIRHRYSESDFVLILDSRWWTIVCSKTPDVLLWCVPINCQIFSYTVNWNEIICHSSSG